MHVSMRVSMDEGLMNCLLGKPARRATSFALVEVCEEDALGNFVSKRAYETDAWCYALKLGVQISQGGCVHR